MVSLALFQPDQAGNCGTLIRLSACLDIPLHIIHPCGFFFSHEKLRRSGMDYIEHAHIIEHDDYDAFLNNTLKARKILLTTKTSLAYSTFSFQKNDILILGRESSGAPEYVHDSADARITIPMHGTMRSINMAIAGAMVIGFALGVQ